MRLLSVLALVAGPALAQDVVASYVAVIGPTDLYNSGGERLPEPWQVLRQDRANLHRFGRGDRGDEWDPLFADAQTREAMERLVRAGPMSPAARAAILAGGATVLVTVCGSSGIGDCVEVTVIP